MKLAEGGVGRRMDGAGREDGLDDGGGLFDGGNVGGSADLGGGRETSPTHLDGEEGLSASRVIERVANDGDEREKLEGIEVRVNRQEGLRVAGAEAIGHLGE